MTLREVIEYADRIKPNNFDNDDMVRWINEIEGMIQTEIYLLDIHEVIQYTWEDNQNTELLVMPPYDKIYTTYILAEIDNANGEYNRYANTKLQFDKAFADYSRYVAQNYAPANSRAGGRARERKAIVDGIY